MHFTHSNEWYLTYIILDTMLWVKLTKDFSIHSRKSLTKQVKLQHKTHRLRGNSNYENLQIINLTEKILLVRIDTNHFMIIFYVQGKWIGLVYPPTYLKHLLQSYLELQQPTLGRKLLLIIHRIFKTSSKNYIKNILKRLPFYTMLLKKYSFISIVTIMAVDHPEQA